MILKNTKRMLIHKLNTYLKTNNFSREEISKTLEIPLDEVELLFTSDVSCYTITELLTYHLLIGSVVVVDAVVPIDKTKEEK